jgi:hypothetical protein
MIHHIKEVEWDRKNPSYPLKPVSDATVKPARPLVDKREVFELKKVLRIFIILHHIVKLSIILLITPPPPPHLHNE